MKKRVWAIALLIVLVAIASLWVFRGSWTQPSEAGFSVVSLKDNTVLISDADVVAYNWTSQEITLTDVAVQRLTQIGESLYAFSPGFSIRINNEEIYQGIFRTAYMSAMPGPPKIAILFPSMSFPSDTVNNHALRLFFPSYQSPSNQTQEDSKLAQYFEQENKLVH